MKRTSTAPRALIYALGGGRGHATRSRNLAGWFGPEWQVELLWPERLRTQPCSWPVHYVSGPEQVQPLLQRLQPDLLLVDTFPRGLMGELTPTGPAWLIGRWLKPDYAARRAVQASLSLYQAVLNVELTPWDGGADVGPVVPPPAPPGEPRRLVWLGSGPPAEQHRLRQLLPPGVTVAAPDLGCARGDLVELLAAAALVISAAGYNAYHEIVQAGCPVIFWPQSRLYDQQEIRARGQLGPAPRSWHRCVSDEQGLRSALEEWREVRPPAAVPVRLADPAPFRDYLERFLGGCLKGRISLASRRPQM